MLSSEISRSLQKKHAELVNYAESLSCGRELEILKLIDVLDRVRLCWREEQNKNVILHENSEALEREKKSLSTELKVVKEQLRDARAQIASLLSEKQTSELEVHELERKMDLVRDLLKGEYDHLNAENQRKLAFLKEASSIRNFGRIPDQAIVCRNAQTAEDTMDDDIDYDKTGETVDMMCTDDEEEVHLRSGRSYRRSRSTFARPIGNGKRSKSTHMLAKVEDELEASAPKRVKEQDDAIITTTTKVYIDPEGIKPSKAKITVRRSANRSMSESNILSALDRETATETMATSCTLTPCVGTKSAIDIRTPLTGRTWTNGSSIETRAHHFVTYSSLLGDKCVVCYRWIGLAGKPACKCTDCGTHLHRSCIPRVPLPCIPRIQTPRTPKQKAKLKDFCPQTRPMIPPLIIHCVVALERDRLSCEGIYRIPGSDSQISKLLYELKSSRVMPKFELIDTETITGCVKRFLKELKDTLIPSTSWNEFVTASETNDFDALSKAIMDLPLPNRDTLAYLCAHFQKVSENSMKNRMTPEVLARSIAPTIVGPSPFRMVTMTQSAEEAKKQIEVLMNLLHFPRSYWKRLYTDDYPTETMGRGCGTPMQNSENQPPLIGSAHRRKNSDMDTFMSQVTQSGEESILGPVRTPPTGQRKLMLPINRRGKFFGDPY